MAADHLSQVSSALSDPTRRDMVARLTLVDGTVNEFAEPYGITVQSVSKHLRVDNSSTLPLVLLLVTAGVAWIHRAQLP